MDSNSMELYNSIDAQNIQDTKKKLETIIQATNFEVTETGVLETLLEEKHEDLCTLTAQSIAELAKSPENRKLLTKKEVIWPLVQLCKVPEMTTYFHSFRAIGNICYENEGAREIVNSDGLQILIDRIGFVAGTVSTTNNFQILPVLSGCLLNVLMLNDDLQKVALKCNVLNTLESILIEASNDLQNQEDSIIYVLQILSLVLDHMEDQWMSEKLCSLLVNMLKLFVNHEISILVLEIFRVQSEYDDIKLWLAKHGVCEFVCELVERYGSLADDEESRSILKLACDLVVLILTGDMAMDFLYDASNGKVFRQMISWLTSDDTDLVTTGVLAIGNFARNDSHCIYMIDSGIAQTLLDTLLKCKMQEDDIKLQYALLSALRHLSIPSQNKRRLIDANIIEVLHRLTCTDYSPVVFKLMGTFRMLLDGQDKSAFNLITQRDFLERIIHWYYNSAHLGINSEAPRLLAALIKNCHSNEFIRTCVIVPNIVNCLTEMIVSSYTVMQNEALLSLNIICSYCVNIQMNGTTDEALNKSGNSHLDRHLNNTKCSFINTIIDADIGRSITFIINKHHEKMEKETIYNLLVLLDELTKSRRITEHLKKSNLSEAILLLLATNKNSYGFNGRLKSLALSCE